MFDRVIEKETLRLNYELTERHNSSWAHLFKQIHGHITFAKSLTSHHEV